MVVRSQVPISDDHVIYESVRQLAVRMKPGALVAHLRNASSGCIDVADPHPFVGKARGRTFMLIHNGGIWGKDMEHLQRKLFAKPPEPRTCPDHPVDSEYLFLNLLDRLEYSLGDDLDVIREWACTIREGLTIYWTAFNVVISDGRTIWAVRSTRRTPGYYLHYNTLRDDSCHIVSTEALPTGAWRLMENDTLAMFQPGLPPHIEPLEPLPWETAPSVGR